MIYNCITTSLTQPNVCMNSATMCLVQKLILNLQINVCSVPTRPYSNTCTFYVILHEKRRRSKSFTVVVSSFKTPASLSSESPRATKQEKESTFTVGRDWDARRLAGEHYVLCCLQHNLFHCMLSFVMHRHLPPIEVWHPSHKETRDVCFEMCFLRQRKTTTGNNSRDGTWYGHVNAMMKLFMCLSRVHKKWKLPLTKTSFYPGFRFRTDAR